MPLASVSWLANFRANSNISALLTTLQMDVSRLASCKIAYRFCFRLALNANFTPTHRYPKNVVEGNLRFPLTLPIMDVRFFRRHFPVS